jgi:hypothetical protein
MGGADAKGRFPDCEQSVSSAHGALGERDETICLTDTTNQKIRPFSSLYKFRTVYCDAGGIRTREYANDTGPVNASIESASVAFGTSLGGISHALLCDGYATEQVQFVWWS